jgi:hypothetical protein
LARGYKKSKVSAIFGMVSSKTEAELVVLDEYDEGFKLWSLRPKDEIEAPE